MAVVKELAREIFEDKSCIYCGAENFKHFKDV